MAVYEIARRVDYLYCCFRGLTASPAGVSWPARAAARVDCLRPARLVVDGTRAAARCSFHSGSRPALRNSPALRAWSASALRSDRVFVEGAVGGSRRTPSPAGVNSPALCAALVSALTSARQFGPDGGSACAGDSTNDATAVTIESNESLTNMLRPLWRTRL